MCSNFRQIIEQMAQSHPDCAFSLFTMNFDGEDFDSFIENLQTPYVKHDWSMWGCAILMPLSVVEECFQYIDAFFDENVHESHGIHCFLKWKGIPILSTLPVTVQHIGDDSLYDPDLPVRRTTRFEVDPTADWASLDVATPPDLEWFKPKRIAGAPDRLDSLLKMLRGVKDDE